MDSDQSALSLTKKIQILGDLIEDCYRYGMWTTGNTIDKGRDWLCTLKKEQELKND